MKSKATGIQYRGGDVYDLEIRVQKDAAGKIMSGFVVGPTIEQNMACLLIAEPGDYKFDFGLGVGLRSALLDEDLLKYRHAIKQHFAQDGLNVRHLELYNLETFSINAEYE
ncbi:hypothetical protein [Chryseobacterium sp.]|uniref:hypothetical protein n=1 Tax=Chryseobacterium sp. TaxID=1871047 RepID=UPI0012AA3203|nr:hypothetical protein [Chryseobacterium sp.]QFG53632.1 hypothetical protein F7R58_08735 [Chryseobacterium sp.]